ncbi:single-stranded-DNA-specific exonuclease RecJ [Oecophyllibacter saccharovorans]|uniref:single-stranded-DNA-specific exonuclease RecJ n=1 Tax=Oecophyllibacter saccharovorans TaxID=2558360 RepID=UPI00116FCA66|nr:single-stranded-DNA-specific exonuclease RecJ [Oecophyllibacter saccharovorans]TPW35210.1 single-stranded-DNA-specific exonuclease RecJ [Oecophyllibacter saccharovorans]
MTPRLPDAEHASFSTSNTAPAPASGAELLVFGVNASAGGRRWIWRLGPQDNTSGKNASTQETAQEMIRQHRIGDLTARILAARGLSLEDVPGFLTPRLRDAMPDPSTLAGMDEAVARLARAVQAGETIGVFGDYDVDGACGTALLADTLRALGCTVCTHIPDRMKEGYGPNAPALQALMEQGATLLVCVDCGTTALDVLDGFEGQADRIVLDHHKPDLEPASGKARLPRGIVVNPNRPDCRSGLGHVCATAVAFLTMVGLQRQLRRQGWFETHPAPDLMAQLDLTALATICDVMPLRGLNRALVTQGLKVLEKGRRIGLAALAEVAGVRDMGNAMSCGFALGPRINAGGRIARAGLGLKLLLSTSLGEARAVAEELDGVNRKRQTVESHILDAALAQAQAQVEAGHAVILVHDETGKVTPEGATPQAWHPGVVGIVAGRLKERFNRPVLVGARVEDVQGRVSVKGSARSIAGLDLGEAVLAAQRAGLLLSGGGHAMAAGFALEEAQLPAFHAHLDHYLGEARTRPRQADLQLDGVVSLTGATIALARQLACLAPFGPGNPEPLLTVGHVRCVKADRIGRDGNTLRVLLQGEDGRARLKGLVFRASEKPFAALLEDRTMPLMHVAGHLRSEVWQERESVTFFIEDAAPA